MLHQKKKRGKKEARDRPRMHACNATDAGRFPSSSDNAYREANGFVSYCHVVLVRIVRMSVSCCMRESLNEKRGYDSRSLPKKERAWVISPKTCKPHSLVSFADVSLLTTSCQLCKMHDTILSLQRRLHNYFYIIIAFKAIFCSSWSYSHCCCKAQNCCS